MKSEKPYIQDDLVSVVEAIVDRRMKYFRTYVGIVQSVDASGFATCTAPEFGTFDDDPASWITAAPGNRMYSAIPPKVGDSVEIYFPEGTPDRVRYRALDGVIYSSPNGGLNKYVLFELANCSLIYDDTAKTLTLKISGNSVTIDGTANNITLSTGTGKTAVLDSTGILKADNEIIWNNATTPTHASTHTHNTGVGPSSAPVAGS